jgi:hypothetical protein
MYSATMCGIISGRGNSPIKTWVTNSGYEQFHQYKDGGRVGTYVHRFVYEFYKGEVPEGLVVDHIDSNKLNNSITNLQVLSVANNTLKGGTGKVSLEQRGEIQLMYNSGKLQREIAEVFGVSQPSICAILKKLKKEKL